MSFRELGWSATIALLCVLASAALIAWDFNDGTYLLLSWPVQILGIAAMTVSIYRARHWWLLLFLPVLGFPLVLWVMLLYECGRGNCL